MCGYIEVRESGIWHGFIDVGAISHYIHYADKITNGWNQVGMGFHDRRLPENLSYAFENQYEELKDTATHETWLTFEELEKWVKDAPNEGWHKPYWVIKRTLEVLSLAYDKEDIRGVFFLDY